jgi:hypothetical protein
MSVNERSQVNTPVGTVATTGIVTGFEIIVQSKLIGISAYNIKCCLASIDGKRYYLACVFRRKNIIRGNKKG